MLADRLFEALTDLTEALDRTRTLPDASAVIADFALANLDSDHAGVALHPADGGVIRLAATGPVVHDLDAAQALGEPGPGSHDLEAGSILTIADTRTDTRWPAWSARAAAAGVLSARLVGLTQLNHGSATLDLFSHEPHTHSTAGFLHARRAAKHAGLGLRLVDRIANLEEGLASRTLIGQAQGMLMERYGLSADHAMSYLRRNSQHANVKVRDLARAIVADRDARPGDQPSTM
ncbi:ANTAR domain-containing protein [Nocardioides sp. LS1]|uniref:ANTAR domain-containing protein n=1 Tax=Nocardioides sp. LS1 TaxID=1027620 RepID=UPI000F61A454|nr:ANTAR domain-containing protein [Nocardioides sp. LS1]GCD91345.1 transcriptional regulator [Nocardioides sp. LS1]